MPTPLQTDQTLGPSFEDAKLLTIGEMAVLLGKTTHEREEKGEHVTDMMRNILEYTSYFKTKKLETDRHMRNKLATYGLEPIELVQLANLCPDTIEDACSYIPTLTKLDNVTLQKLISELTNIKQFT